MRSVEQITTRKLTEDNRTGLFVLSRSRKRLLVPVLMLFIYSVQCLWFVRTQSLTYDEPLHLRAGLEAWRYGRFEQVLDHPPLGHLLPTIFIAPGHWNITFDDSSGSLHVTSITPDPVELANRTRPVNVVLGVLLGWMLWSTARKLFSTGAANVAITLFAFSPSLIAHFSLVTTDGICTLMVFAAAAQVLRWRSHASLTQTLLSGVTLGLLLLSKLSTIPLFGLTLLLMLVLKPDHLEWTPRRWNFRAAILAMCVSIFVVWAGYFFHVSRLRIGDGVVYLSSPNREPVIRHAVAARFKFMRGPLQRHFNLLIPAGEYLEGIAEIALHNQIGHSTFLNGHVSHSPSFKFHVVVAMLKWPPVVWLLFLCSIVSFLWRKVKPPPDFYVILLYPLLLLLVVMSARITMGERHFLPVYPFILLIASASWELVMSPISSRIPSSLQRTGWATAIIVLLVLNAVDVLRYCPDYLSYTTIAIPNRASYHYLSDSNLDWGQGLLALRRYEAEHPNESIRLAYFGITDPKMYGIRAIPLAENERVSGTVVVSETHMAGQYLKDPTGYQWLTKYPPKAILNHSLFVFGVPPEASQP
jgi:hypothetical protein